MSEFTETPQIFLNETKDDPLELSSREIHNWINSHRHLSKETLVRYQVDMLSRLASPWTCLVVTLIGIPFGTHTGRKGALAGITLCIGMFFTYYLLLNLGLALGKSQTIPPVIATWGPNTIFLLISVVLIYRMR